MKSFKYFILAIALCMIEFFPIESYAISYDKGPILIDPGHGGIDGGAKSIHGFLEKKINLEIGTKLKDSLEKKGYKVHMTRENDEALSNKKKDDLWLRCKMKKDVGCDIFISIHQNTFPSSNSRGAQVWYASNSNSKELARHIQESIKTNVDSKNNREPKDAKNSYMILRDGHQGANLILECGFLSNPTDEQNLTSEAYQQKLVDSIILGIEKYYQSK